MSQAERFSKLIEGLKNAFTSYWSQTKDKAREQTYVLESIRDETRKLLLYIEKLSLKDVLADDNSRQDNNPSNEAEPLMLLSGAAYLQSYCATQGLIASSDAADSAAKINQAPRTSLDPLLIALIEQHQSETLSALRKILVNSTDWDDCLEQIKQAVSQGHLLCLLRPAADPAGNIELPVNEELLKAIWNMREEHLTGPNMSLLEAAFEIVCEPRDSLGQLHESLRDPAALFQLARDMAAMRNRLPDDDADILNHLAAKGFPDEKIKRRLLKKWLTATLVKDVRVSVENEKRLISVLLVYKPIPYRLIRNSKRLLFQIRKVVEGDFEQVNHLRQLVTSSKSGLQIELLFDVEPAQGEANKVSIGESVRQLLDEIVPPPSDDWDDCRLIEAPDTFQFSPLPSGLKLPASLRFLYLLSYLKAFRSRSETEIKDMLAVLEYKDASLGYKFNVITKKDDYVSISESESEQQAVCQLLELFQERPASIREKVREYQALGSFLPFTRWKSDIVTTGITGLDNILNVGQSTTHTSPGFEYAKNILLQGGPGTGKTTMLVQILHSNLLNSQRSVLLITFEEMEPVLARTYGKLFGWEIDFIESVDPRRKDVVLSDITKRIATDQPDVIAIDGLSRLHYAYSDPEYREKIHTFFRFLQVRRITCIASIEEPSGQGAAEEYQADGVIHLRAHGDARTLTIKKLRSQNYTPGDHAFEILDQTRIDEKKDSLNLVSDEFPYQPGIDEKKGSLKLVGDKFPYQPGINVYPNEEYFASRTDGRFQGATEEANYIPTGVRGLESVLPGGYREGDTILVQGSPGAGKTLFGLHFLRAEFEDARNGKKKVEPEGSSDASQSKVLWLSFEGPKPLLRRSVTSFDPNVGFDALLKLSSSFIFEFVPPALISPERVFYFIDHLVTYHSIKRIVIDSISEIQEAFPKSPRFRQFMTTLIHCLSQKGVTTMLLHRSHEFFHTSQETEYDIATLVDTVISIKTFDMKNQIRRGLFVLKSRGREQRSKLQTMKITTQEGIIVSDRGWEIEGLLSGETGPFREPKVFLKHFYENQAETRINEEIVKEFAERYAQTVRFTEVRKHSIHSEFWSFRGHYGAGHANTRVVSINRYMVEAFRERNSLQELDHFFSQEFAHKIENIRWSRYNNDNNKSDNIPLYVDLGFLVVRSEMWEKLKTTLNKSVRDEIEAAINDKTRVKHLLSWQTLRRLTTIASFKGEPAYVFALPYLYSKAEFMAFFFEILWSMGGDVYHFSVKGGDEKKKRDDFYKDQVLLNKVHWNKLINIFEEALDSEGKGTKEGPYEPKKIWERSESLFDLVSATKNREGQAVDSVEARKKQVEDLRRFVEEKLKFGDDDVITINNKFAQKALSFIYDLVYESGGSVRNPYYGDFKSQAVFSRFWYSQIEGLRNRPKASKEQSLDTEELHILALPYFEEKRRGVKEVRKKSCTFEAVVCIGLIVEALSPEIGWIFIDTLASDEWVEKRAEYKLGFPYQFEEVASMANRDPEAYAILQNIVDNKQRKDLIYDAERKLTSASDMDEAAVKKTAEELFSGKFQERGIRDLLNYTGPKGWKSSKKCERAFIDYVRKAIQDKKLDQRVLRESRASDHSEFEEDLVLRSKLPEHRPFYRLVESILHEEIAKLFSPNGRQEWYTIITESPRSGMSNKQIDEELARDGAKDRLIKKALERMENRLIFDLLTGLTSEIEARLETADSRPRTLNPDLSG